VNVCQFQYFDPSIIIKGNFINKEEVFYSALSGILLNSQSSKHFINVDGSYVKIIDIHKKYSLF